MSSWVTEPASDAAYAVARARRAGSYPVSAAVAGIRTPEGGSGCVSRAEAGGPIGVGAGAVGGGGRVRVRGPPPSSVPGGPVAGPLSSRASWPEREPEPARGRSLPAPR